MSDTSSSKRVTKKYSVTLEIFGCTDKHQIEEKYTNPWGWISDNENIAKRFLLNTLTANLDYITFFFRIHDNHEKVVLGTVNYTFEKEINNPIVTCSDAEGKHVEIINIPDRLTELIAGNMIAIINSIDNLKDDQELFKSKIIL